MSTVKDKGTQSIVVRVKQARQPRLPRQRKFPKGTKTQVQKIMFNPVLRNHWEMIADPCFATLAESAYRGRSGIVSRFTQLSTYNTGVSTGLVAVFNPAAGSGNVTGFTDSTIPTAAVVYNYALPGQAFLLANSEGSRVIGACLDIDYLGTELNRSGMFYGGVVLGDSVPAGVGITPDSYKQLLPNQCRTPDRQVTQLWFPGVGNEGYGNVGASSTAFTSEYNSLGFIAEGLPAGIQIRIRLTTVVEWLPLQGVGVAMPSPTSGYNPVGAYERLHDAAAKTTAFTHSFAAGASEKATAYARKAGETLVDVAVAGAATYVRDKMMPKNRNYGNLQINA